MEHDFFNLKVKICCFASIKLNWLEIIFSLEIKTLTFCLKKYFSFCQIFSQKNVMLKIIKKNSNNNFVEANNNAVGWLILKKLENVSEQIVLALLLFLLDRFPVLVLFINIFFSRALIKLHVEVLSPAEIFQCAIQLLGSLKLTLISCFLFFITNLFDTETC